MSATLQSELKSLLTGYPDAAAQHLLAGAPAHITDEELDSIEQRLLSDPNVKTGVGELLTALRARADQVCPGLKKNQSTVVLSYPTAKNPFAGGVADEDALYKEGAAWFAAHLAVAEKPSPRTKMQEAALWFKLYLVAAVLEFEILEPDYLPALVRSLERECEKGQTRILRLHRTLTTIPIALAARGGEKQEERLLVSGTKSYPLLQRFLDHPKHDDMLTLLTKGGTPAADQIIARLEDQVPHAFRFNLDDLIEAAQSVARLRMRPAIASHRSREYVSHGLRIDVLNRLGGYSLAPLAKDHPHASRPAKDPADDPQHGQPPPWMIELREAVKRDRIDKPALERLAKDKDICGQRMAKYALWLKWKASSVHRYVFLIATRLMPRFDSGLPLDNAADTAPDKSAHGRDPAFVDDDTWQEVIEQVLDEDEFFRRPDLENSKTRRRLGNSRPLLQAMHSFVRFLEGDKKELASLHKKFPAAGLMQVDANLISVDEYKAALDWLGSVEVYPDAEMIEASRVALILGFRGGLRRAESGYLRLGDFDDADFLHVRPSTMRKLKTSNARRDLPLAVLIPADELTVVKRRIKRIRERAEAALQEQNPGALTPDVTKGKAPNPAASNHTKKKERTWRDAVLFPTRKDPFRAGDFEKVVDLVHASIQMPKKDLPGNPDFHYHILRHSFANTLALKLWPELHLVARRIFHRHPETLAEIAGCEKFRQDLFGTDRIRGSDLQGIALLMGHGSAATTLEHYLHLVDWYRLESAEAGSRSSGGGDLESGCPDARADSFPGAS